MNKKQPLIFSREKKVTLTFDGTTAEFTLLAPSAKDKEAALLEAQQLHAETIKQLTEAAEAIKAVYLLQDQELLIKAALVAESEQLCQKATLTLVKDTEDYEDRLQAKVQILQEGLRLELQTVTKEQLADKLCSLEMGQQMNLSWIYSVLHANLARSLRGEAGERVFSSVEIMKESLPSEVLEKLLEELLEFLSGRGDAQVFPKPHISKG